MRQDLTPELLDRFLRRLGEEVRNPVRLLITGGASMLLRKLRGQTLDVDISYQVDPLHETALTGAIRQLKESLNLNIELAEPGQFMPLPRGREHRLVHAGRYGSVEVFLDDPYTVALSKLHRGHEKDLEDVRLLARGGFLELKELESKLREIAAPETPGAARMDLERLLARLSRVVGGK